MIENKQIKNEQNNREHIARWLRLHLTDQVGAITFAKLLKHFGGIEQVMDASAGHLTSVPGVGVKTARRIAESRDNIDVEAELNLADELGVRIITLDCTDYPPLLKQIHDPPAVLYVKGNLTRADELAVAVVGSRTCSHYGHEQASRLSHLLAAAGFTIVSGLARGIDSAAHRGALAADGRTIAVQGRGLAGVFPPENTDLAQRIAENGALISELPLQYEPLSGTFPARNRIISGLSLATIVVEAGKRSGALITAHSAMEQNREVMAVPGRVDAPGSAGPHKLIKDGAVLVESIQDILEALGRVGKILKSHADEAATKAQRANEPALFNLEQIHLTESESAVFDCLDHEPCHTDRIIAQSKLAPGGVYAALTSLQLKGLVKQLPGGFYQKNRMGND